MFTVAKLYIALAGAALVAAVGGGIWWYGHSQYSAGHAQAVLEATAAAETISEQYRAKETAAQNEAEAKYADYQKQIATTKAHAADLDSSLSGLRDRLATLSATATKNTKASGRVNAAAGPDFIGVIAECAGRYDEVAKYAAGLADQVVGLQGYIATVVAE